MVLIQIAEPGQSSPTHRQRQCKIAVGIDLGTTNSLIATVQQDTQQATILNVDGNPLVPSAVCYADGKLLVGQSALEQFDPSNTLSSTKRLIGKSYAEIIKETPHLTSQLNPDVQNPLYKTAIGDISPVQVATDILRYLVEASKLESIEGAVITVPAYFDDAQRQATKNAAELADLKVLRLLNEPTAAAIAYGLDHNEDCTIAVYDLGGGTFDVSILSLQKGIFQVLATVGDSSLGGDDFDKIIARWVTQQIGINWDTLNYSDYRQLVATAKQAKEQLANDNSIVIEHQQQSVVLTSSKMAELLQPTIQPTLTICKQALADAQLTIDEIDEIVMVGGSTRVNSVRTSVKALFGRDLKTDIDPDTVVALGAAIQANILIGNKSSDEMLLLDVIPLSLSIEIMGGITEKIIHRNSTIPVSRAQQFTTAKDGQTSMIIHVLQGEREQVEDCRSLARFTLKGIPPMVAGSAHIEVRFQVDADGILSASAIEQSTQTQASIEVKPSFGLSDETIKQMLHESIENAEQDIATRQQRERQIEAQQLIDYLSNAIAQDGSELLSKTEITQLQKSLNYLSSISHNPDSTTDQIRNAIAKTTMASDEFAQRRMDKSIQLALQGKSLDNIESTN